MERELKITISDQAEPSFSCIVEHGTDVFILRSYIVCTCLLRCYVGECFVSLFSRGYKGYCLWGCKDYSAPCSLYKVWKSTNLPLWSIGLLPYEPPALLDIEMKKYAYTLDRRITIWLSYICILYIDSPEICSNYQAFWSYPSHYSSYNGCRSIRLGRLA